MRFRRVPLRPEVKCPGRATRSGASFQDACEIISTCHSPYLSWFVRAGWASGTGVRHHFQGNGALGGLRGHFACNCVDQGWRGGAGGDSSAWAHRYKSVDLGRTPAPNGDFAKSLCIPQSQVPGTGHTTRRFRPKSSLSARRACHPIDVSPDCGQRLKPKISAFSHFRGSFRTVRSHRRPGRRQNPRTAEHPYPCPD